MILFLLLQHWLTNKIHSYFLVTDCPLGFDFHTGDKVEGHTNIESELAEDIEECGTRCNRNQNCKSFAWSDTEKTCALMRSESTDGPFQYMDYRLCSKVIGETLDYLYVEYLRS